MEKRKDHQQLFLVILELLLHIQLSHFMVNSISACCFFHAVLIYILYFVRGNILPKLIYVVPTYSVNQKI